MSNKVKMLTTTDNPYDPLTEFDKWNTFDMQKGYNTCSYIDRIAINSHNLVDEDYEKAYEMAIEEIAKFNILGLYKIVEYEYEK